MISPKTNCFNGATTMVSWKDDPVLVGLREEWSFNGATTMASWKGLRYPDSSCGNLGFNGATTMSSWKGTSQHRIATLTAELQWGHDDVVVEGCGGGIHFVPHPNRFNGATTMSSWKGCVAPRQWLIARLASMGPRRWRRGKVG